MQGFITRDVYQTKDLRRCCGTQINAATTQRGEPDKTGQGYEKKSDFRCRRKPEYQEKTYEVGYGSATKLTNNVAIQSAVVRGECFDFYTSPTSQKDA